MNKHDLPLDGITVLDLSQFLAGPLVSLRLADMGARVIKIERPVTGDLSRELYLTDTDINGVNTLFHAINRNKESYAVDLKSEEGIRKIYGLIEKSDILIVNFRPEVIARLCLDYENIKKYNENIIYASISGYGPAVSWDKLPGQDLLAQAKSGVMWLSGDADQPPVPIGLSVADMLAGHNTLEGILTALIRRYKKNTGAIIETSLIESILDLQFELLTAYLNEGQKQQPERSQTGNANVYLSAPYGVYKTSDGYIAIAMIPVDHLGKLLGSDELASYTEPKSWFAHRDYIKQIISNILNHNTSSHWIEVLESADGWAAEVLNWKELFNTSAFGELDFIQELLLCNGRTIYTTRNPIRMDGHRLKCNVPAPEVGQHNTRIEKEFGL